MYGFAGYNFKSDKLNDSQRETLNDYLMVFDNIDGASEWKIEPRSEEAAKIYLLRPKGTKLSIFGVHCVDPAAEKSDGIVWGTNESNMLQALYYIKLNDFAYPYNVEEDAIYFVQDGEVYINFRKGDRVRTPEGNGVIYSIDDLNDVCVELDHDKSVFYEFTVNEIEKTKEA